MVYLLQCILIYIIAVLCFGKKFEKMDSKNNQKYFLWIVFAIFAIIMGIRKINVGVDTKTYAEHYTYLLNASWIDIFAGNASPNTMEIGWNILVKICTYISPHYLFFQILYSMIYCGLSACFVTKTKNVFVTTILFLGTGLYTGAFNVQRQFLATAFLANSYMYFKEKKMKQTVICFFSAVLMHKLSICFIVVFLVCWAKNNLKILKIIPIVGIILAFNYSNLIVLASKILPQYHNYYSNQKGIPQTASGVWIIWIIMFIIAVYSIYSDKIKSQDYKVVCIFSMAYVVCNIVGLYFNYFERIGWYFLPFVVIMFCDFGTYIEKIVSIHTIKKIYYVGLTISFTLYYLLSCFTGSALKYDFFWT